MAIQMLIDPHVLTAIDVGSVPGVATAVAKSFEWFEGAINEEARDGIRQSLTDLRPSAIVKPWPVAFSEIVDKVFGRRPLSLSFILRSCVASLLAVAVVGLIFLRRDAIYYSFLAIAGRRFTFQMGVFPLISNLVPDYFSLLVSRWVIRMMIRRNTFGWTATLLGLDLLATLLVAVIGIAFTNIVYSLAFTPAGIPGLSRGDVAILSTRAFFRNRRLFAPPYHLLFWASFFTSIWVWLYAVSGFTLNFATKLDSGLRFVNRYLDMEKPLASLGKVAGVFAGAGVAVFHLIAYFWPRNS